MFYYHFFVERKQNHVYCHYTRVSVLISKPLTEHSLAFFSSFHLFNSNKDEHPIRTIFYFDHYLFGTWSPTKICMKMAREKLQNRNFDSMQIFVFRFELSFFKRKRKTRTRQSHWATTDNDDEGYDFVHETPRKHRKKEVYVEKCHKRQRGTNVRHLILTMYAFIVVRLYGCARNCEEHHWIATTLQCRTDMHSQPITVRFSRVLSSLWYSMCICSILYECVCMRSLCSSYWNITSFDSPNGSHL